MLSIDDLFKGRHFDREIIVLCVRWYLRFKLSNLQSIESFKYPHCDHSQGLRQAISSHFYLRSPSAFPMPRMDA